MSEIAMYFAVGGLCLVPVFSSVQWGSGELFCPKRIGMCICSGVIPMGYSWHFFSTHPTAMLSCMCCTMKTKGMMFRSQVSVCITKKMGGGGEAGPWWTR